MPVICTYESLDITDSLNIGNVDICFQISQGKHLEVELLGHMLSICLTLHVIVWLLHTLAKHGIFSLLHFSLSRNVNQNHSITIGSLERLK